ncbi:hypothetical protein O3P69_016394 [Scylla paramamosain]|uniref:Glutathione peroxidase n=1 Tax=Scylla paramamosain TaxID=85552 RepID=A0AAW0TDF1_SCYPA
MLRSSSCRPCDRVSQESPRPSLADTEAKLFSTFLNCLDTWTRCRGRDAEVRGGCRQVSERLLPAEQLQSTLIRRKVSSRMLWAGLVSLAAVGVAAQDRVPSRACYHHETDGGSIYDFTEADLFETRNISLSEHLGKVVLIVNVATY